MSISTVWENESLQSTQKCLIFTGMPSLSIYRDFSGAVKAYRFQIYHCINHGSVEQIPAAEEYEILLDFFNIEIVEIVNALFNKVMQLKCDLNVKIIGETDSLETKFERTMKLLRKLESNRLIKLDVVEDHIKSEIRNLTVSPLENVLCFLGPGNTGKSAIISSLSELFSDNRQTVALLDFSKEHKLKDYFHESMNISEEDIENRAMELVSYSLNGEADRYIDVYTYTNKPYEAEQTDIMFLIKTIKKLSGYYDYVLVNTNEQMLKDNIYLFRLFGKIMIVPDCILNKIPSLHQMLIQLYKFGIDTRKTISIIYNKLERKASYISMIEEKMIYESNGNGWLTPLIDIYCSTFEIKYHKHTMAALNEKFVTKNQTLRNTSANYFENIHRIYQFINDRQLHYDCTEMNIKEFICSFIFKRFMYYPLINLKRFFILKTRGILKPLLTQHSES